MPTAEIALRIIRACKELGIHTVAVHSTADETSLHRFFSDQDVCIGSEMAADSYLNIPRIISAAEITNAGAIHPGYGFLAENSKFARICAENKIKFIGPTPEVIDKMGDKATARETMKKAGVPIIPGTGIIADETNALKAANEIGYPVIIKATAGGGGKGMRICKNDNEIKNNFPIARNEAGKSFNNPDVYMEKYIENPHHIEIQILADEHGNIIHLGERDCSIQRRHQKLIEETPSPIMNPELRRQMGEAAVKGAKEVGYTGAGTIEFLVDDADGKFYFMEMNTRIQVEHSISELLTTIDIVKWQIRVAAGEKLKYSQGDIGFKGHCIECRINAEDPEHDFRPNPGKITGYHLPQGLGVRVDSHCYAEYVIPPYYDSLIGKLIVWGEDRTEAIARMKRSLDELTIQGIKTTIPFHKQVMNNEDFIKGSFTTRFLENFKMTREENHGK